MSVESEHGPAVAGPIQVIAPGLLGFLQLKSQGLNPHSLNLDIQPTMDLTKWLYQASFDVVEIAISLAAGVVGFSGDPALITVPTNQTWYVLDANCTGLITNPDRLAIAVAWRRSNTAPANSQIFFPGGGQFSDVSYVGANVYDVIANARDYFMPPGAQAGVYQSCADHPGAISSALKLRIARLPN